VGPTTREFSPAIGALCPVRSCGDRGGRLRRIAARLRVLYAATGTTKSAIATVIHAVPRIKGVNRSADHSDPQRASDRTIANSTTSSSLTGLPSSRQTAGGGLRLFAS
jgi:hypothetical protein